MSENHHDTLDQNEQQYRLIFDHAALGIFTFDKNGRIYSCNPSFVEIMGSSTGALIGLDLLNLSDTRVVQAVENALAGKTAIFEGDYLSETGNKLTPLRVIFNSLFSEDGGIDGAMGIVEDITEKRQAQEERDKLEAQIRHAQKMESIGRLAGGVAHDFNNMIAIINGYAEIMRDSLSPSDPVYPFLNEILGAGWRSAALVRQLLAFARKQAISPVNLNMNDVVASTLKMLQRLIGENIDLVWKPGSSLWVVKMDPGQVDQILANLAVNARDAISDVGKMTLETKNVVIEEDYCKKNTFFLPGSFVMLAVSDNGCGIDKKGRERLFEPFYTTKPRGHGTGLGLSTVYGIVKQNNGFINVYSEPGNGTTFRIYIPAIVKPKSAVEDESRTADVISAGTETILLVEDEEKLLLLFKNQIESLGYTVLAANSPQKAITMAMDYQGGLDLLVTDVIMPEMNGKDLSRELSARCPGIRTLFMSGYTEDAIAHHGILDKGLHFINKPFAMIQLSQKIRSVLDGPDILI